MRSEKIPQRIDSIVRFFKLSIRQCVIVVIDFFLCLLFFNFFLGLGIVYVGIGLSVLICIASLYPFFIRMIPRSQYLNGGGLSPEMRIFLSIRLKRRRKLYVRMVDRAFQK